MEILWRGGRYIGTWIVYITKMPAFESTLLKVQDFNILTVRD
jgi:hypothetical protein